MEFIHSLKEEVDAICGEGVVEILHMVNLSDVYGATLEWVQIGTSNDKYVKATKLFLHTTDDLKYDDGKVYHTLLGHEPITGLFSYAPLPKAISRILPTIPSGQLTGIDPTGLYRASMEWQDGNTPTTGTSWKKWLRCLSREYAPACYWTMWVGLKMQDRLPIGLFVLGKEKLDKSKQLVLAKLLYRKGVEYVVQIHENELRRQSRAAAVSQVLARTLSHNLGSHSLNAFSTEEGMRKQFEEIEYRLRHHICIPGRIVSDGGPCVSTATPCTEEDLQFAPVRREEAEELSRNRRELLARYNNYLRERMDLLADITTAVPAFEMPKQLVADLLEGYARNVLLATTIAGTGGQFRYCWQPAGLIADGKDVNVAIPSDILGNHAFYLILENIVRNSAKHGGHSEEVVFTVKVEEPEDKWKKQGLLKVQITENCTKLEGKNLGLVAERNASINAPVLDDKTRRVRQNGWGTLEMKAACAYLRRIPLEDLDLDKYKAQEALSEVPPLLKAIGGDGKPFGYEFYLMRPKLVMVCADKETDVAVIKSDVLKGEGNGSLQDHGIGAMTLAELEAITKGGHKEVVNHALLVFLAKDENDLKRFIQAALSDLAAFPQEMVVVGWDGSDADRIKKLLAEVKDLLLRGENNGKLSPAAIEHNASILERSVVWMKRLEWEKVSKEPEKLYMEVRHRWLVGWMTYKKYSLDVVPRAYEDYLCRRLKQELASNSILIEADYEAHDDLYIGVKASLEMRVADLDPKPDDLSPWLLAKRKATNPRHVIIQRYPEALSPVMTLGWKRTDTEFNASIKQADRQTWAQHHLASWTQGVAVIDERVQAVAENETYQPAVSEKNKDPKPIRVKDLLCMGGVFVPPGMGLQRSDAFTKELWDQLVDTWLEPLHPMLGYVCIHLTILEKFSRSLKRKVEDLIDEVKSKLTGIRIIVVSGRGKPPELPRSELFMSYSALAQYTTQTYQRAPVLLNILAHSTRRIIPS